MNKTGPKPRSFKARFEEKFTRGTKDECWLWNASIHGRGYGQFQTGTRAHPQMTSASRVAYELYVAKIPEGLHVCHKCDNKRCVNPAHLALGTNQENHIAASIRGFERQSEMGRPPGVYKFKGSNRKKPWVARFLRKSLGTFETAEEAYQAVLEAREKFTPMVTV